MSDEKRRQRRFSTRKRLWCEGQEDPVLGEARNVSQGGMFIVASEEAKVGEQIKVNFKDDQDEISISMEVMWKGTEATTGEAGMGVRIIGFDKGEDVYGRFLERHAPAAEEVTQTGSDDGDDEDDEDDEDGKESA
ncbi:MAG: PilZ domain-containing protein [Myxococcales bacterium]|nr:PilZ domain-containing protein [Myxococcales bacterium]